MATPIVVEQSLVIPVPGDQAFRGTLPAPLPEVFNHWYGPIPPIKEVRDQTGAWDAAGQTRKLFLVGGGSVHEELTSLDSPRSFGYRLSDIKGPMSLLVGQVVGAWIFTPADGGTEITWRWTIHPKSALAAPALPVFGMLWKGYARRGLRNLSALLTR
ncbi:Polyketide cyclase / dehydrase and lipid transport [Mycobacterium marinum]|uniref:Polyketide cyclase / dehydrase and lipid transport n=1 Tax=Mycobacterium marinum TaxID=1781 RepID=A0A3E2MYB9_MYCMR|nr:SRPBCC family protein [Mycobacterium marinum]RFZ43879.1 Polyketide cyclase / dehydrase and lipid transport [Mycobacterium marinum]